MLLCTLVIYYTNKIKFKPKVLQNAPSGAFCNTFDLHLATTCRFKNSLFCLIMSVSFTQVLLYHNNCFLFFREWEKEVVKTTGTKKKPSLVKALFRIFGLEYMLFGFVLLMEVSGVGLLILVLANRFCLKNVVCLLCLLYIFICTTENLYI